MHGGKDQTRVGDLALDVTWAIIPVHPQCLDRAGGRIFGGQKFHDPCQIVRFPRRFTDQVDVV